MQIFAITNNVGIMINTDMNAKNLLIMEDVIKDLFGILVTVNVTNYVMLEKWIEKLVEECIENIDGMKWFIIQPQMIMKKCVILVQYT